MEWHAGTIGNVQRVIVADGMVVAANSGENQDQHRDKKNRDPRAFDKFRDENHEDGDAGDETAESVNEGALDPMRRRVFCASAPPCRIARA